jgi:Ni/Co efflux regulator RcnB
MFKHILAAAVAAALIGAPLAPALAQASTEKSDKTEKKAAKKSDKKSEKKLTAQQQKMKDCAPKWADYKKEKGVKGRAEYRKFMSTCLKA